VTSAAATTAATGNDRRAGLPAAVSGGCAAVFCMRTTASLSLRSVAASATPTTSGGTMAVDMLSAVTETPGFVERDPRNSLRGASAT